MTALSIDLQPLRYRTILADPPWLFETWSEKGEGKAAQAHYDCMPTTDLKRLQVGHLAAPDCLLFMWATFPMLPQALEVMTAWGFRYVAGGAWAKQSQTGDKWAFGPGYRLRIACEPFLLGVIGRPPILSRSERNLIVAPTREHSRKPEEQYRKIEAMGEPPYAELFARSRRPGWDSWGREVDRFTTAEAAE